MLFNSIHFLLFLPIVVLVHYALGDLRYRKYFLLAASYYFYAVWSIPFVCLLVASTGFGYLSARLIDASDSRRTRKLMLVMNLGVNLGILFFFKYFNFITLSFGNLVGFQPWPLLDLVLPLGISFYTFQSMSYTIDVYRGDYPAEKDLLDIALYIAFFPQLVAGPIMRASEFLPQLTRLIEANYENIMRGCLLICIGLTKKVFLADPMGDFVDTVYGSYADYGSGALVLATYAFALQIYFDFSAYTDIAIGAAAILGFRLTQNFRAPYLAASIREFWRRWHISLSTWLRDYLYVSLGGSRHGAVRTYCALSATMLLGGLWHGAAWTFVIWGALHGLYLVVERLSTTRPRDSSAMGPLERLIRTAITLHLVCFAWIFFRAESFEQAFGIVGRIATLAPGESVSAVPALCLIALMAWQYLRERRPYLDVSALVQWPVPARWAIYAMLPLLIVAIAGARSPEFIYFQF